MRQAKQGQIALIIVFWAISVGIGFTTLWRHGGTAGASPNHPAKSIGTRGTVIPLLPDGTAHISDRLDAPLLLIFAHPHCPCTVATLHELTRAMTSVSAARSDAPPARILVVFVVPPGAPPRWERTALWAEASRMAGVQLRTDTDGVLARRFDARTSGQVFLYNKQGGLVFEGGITSGRGHEGDNAGSDAIVDLLTRAYDSSATSPNTRHTPVFGCALL